MLFEIILLVALAVCIAYEVRRTNKDYNPAVYGNSEPYLHSLKREMARVLDQDEDIIRLRAAREKKLARARKMTKAMNKRKEGAAVVQMKQHRKSG